MKKLVLGVLFVLCTSMSACQCSDKPEIGPVEEASASAAVSTDSLA